MIHVVLVNPLIPQNAGAIGRTCLNLGARLHLVGKLGFSLDESKLKRAGLDYWKHVDLETHDSWESFVSDPTAPKNLFFFSKFGTQTLLEASLVPDQSPSDSKPSDIGLIFGSESKGLFDLIGAEAMTGFPIIKLPQGTNHRSGDTASLNVAACVAIVLWEAWRQNQVTQRKNPF